VGPDFPAAFSHLVEGAIKRVVSEQGFDFRWMTGAHRV
jgi:hypothetical protein